MKPPFTVLLVHGDGSRVRRCRVPRQIVYGTLGLVGAVVGFSSVYVALQGAELTAQRRRLADQRDAIDTFDTRVAAIRTEITAWRALHAKMWDALGPAATSSSRSGVGRPVSIAPAAAIDVRPGPTKELDLLTRCVAEEGPRLRALDKVVRRTGAVVHALPLRWPVVGPVKSEFGLRPSPWTRKLERHEGIDIGSLPGTPVQSPAPGTVIAARSGNDYGRHVVLDHSNGVRSLYGHLQKLDVKAGQRVEQGDVIGLVGSTGKSTGPHLHYEVQVDGKPVDPRPFLVEPERTARHSE